MGNVSLILMLVFITKVMDYMSEPTKYHDQKTPEKQRQLRGGGRDGYIGKGPTSQVPASFTPDHPLPHHHSQRHS